MKTDEPPQKLARCLTSLAVVVTILTTASAGRADCPAAPIADNNDLVISFLKANGTQAAPASVLPSSVKEGMLVYDDALDKLKVCDGTNWIAVGATDDTLAGLSCTTGQIAKWDGTVWGCAADGGGTPASPTGSVQFNEAGAFGGDAALIWDNTNKRLGIGTTAPQTKLHVAGGPLTLITETKFWRIGENVDGAQPGVFGIRNQTDGVNALTVTASGNVGIGTPNPGSALQVGSISFQNDGRIRLAAGNGTQLRMYSIGVPYGNTSVTSPFYDFVIRDESAGVDRLVIDYASGYVGIGTANPSAKLQIEEGQLRINASGYPRVEHLLGGSFIWSTGPRTNNDYYIFREGGSGNVLIPSGNVGIGTTSPVAPLTVGTSTGGGAIWLGATNSTDEGAEIIWSGAGSYPVWTQDVYTNYMRFFTNSASNTQVSLANFGAGAMNFDIDGTAYKPGGGVWTASSDARLKDIDGAYEQGLDSIVRLKTVRFHYKTGNPRHEPFDREFIGLIAQDVQDVFPEAVKRRDDGYLDLDTTPINFALINAVKELKAANDYQSAAIEELRQEIKALKATAHEGR